MPCADRARTPLAATLSCSYVIGVKGSVRVCSGRGSTGVEHCHGEGKASRGRLVRYVIHSAAGVSDAKEDQWLAREDS